MLDGLKKELRPLLLLLFLLALGIFLLWLATQWIKKDPHTALGDTVLVALFVMPLIIYAIASGSLKELRGPGGWGATFNTVASATVSEAGAHDPISIDEDPQILKKGTTETLTKRIQELDEVKPIAMTVTFGGGHYTQKALSEYVDALARLRNFKLVVFVDRRDRFLACMSPWAAISRLNTPSLAEEFVQVINEGRQDLFDYPGIVRKVISTQSTNAEALRMMVNHNLEAVAVTDESNRLKGITEREQVLSRMMLALTQ